METLLQQMESLFPAASSAAGALFSAIWQGAVLSSCVALALRLMPRLGAAARSVIWLNVFVLLLLLHLLPSTSAPAVSQWGAHFSPIHLDPRWSMAIVALWAVLSLWKGIELILSAIRLRGIARRAVPVCFEPRSGSELLALLHTRGANGESGRRAELCTSSEVQRPCVLGFFRPRILLPPGLLERLTALELQLVVEHEMEHLRRADDWSNLLQKLGLVLFPLNPVLLWVERRLCAERELACDDRVLNSSAGPKAYAICLTHLAEYSMIYRRLTLVLGAWERQSELVRRVHRILRRPARSMSGKPAALAMTGLVAGALGCAIALARSPQLVSFAPVVDSALQAQSLPSASLRSARFDQMEAAPQLVKAVMPARPAALKVTSKPMHKDAFKRAVARPQIAPVPQQYLVLTEWHSTGWESTEWQSMDTTPQLVIAVDRVTRSSYAAVRTPDGWLIVQI